MAAISQPKRSMWSFAVAHSTPQDGTARTTQSVPAAASSVDPVILQWVQDAIAGDQDAFAELVYSFQDAVYNLCYRMLGERGEAEDAAQETFLRAYLNLKRYDPARSFKTWILSIASNHCIDRIRRRRMHYLSIEDDVLPTLTLSSDEPEPEDVVISGEQSRALDAMLNGLPPEYRAAVVLRYWYDYSYLEIADILATSESAIKSRLFRARQMLVDKLSDDDVPGSLKSILEKR
jgi:RNA polymerase sigma-70 factor, ECF subfamily